MRTYRVLFLIALDDSSRPDEVFDCIDDAEAIGKALHFIDGYDIELREGARFVAKFPRKCSGGLTIGFRLPYEMSPKDTDR